MKSKTTHRLVLLAMAVTVLMSPAMAQDHPHMRTFETFVGPGPGIGPLAGAGQAMFFQRGHAADHPLSDVTYKFISAEMSFDGTVVKGAPFSADASTETTQTLADGNRIVHKNSATLYRDAEGRTRKEQTLEAIGPWTSGEPVRLITINDPIAETSYFLDTKTRVARKMPQMSLPNPAAIGKGEFFMAAPPIGSGEAASAGPKMGMGGKVLLLNQKARNEGKSESLGQQMIEDVLASGTRTTLTIPAGQIGNEKPIEVVSERWYSDDLKTVVMTKHSDPRMGTTVFQLTDIRRDNPMPALFQVPPDYTVEEAPGPIQLRQKIQK